MRFFGSMLFLVCVVATGFWFGKESVGHNERVLKSNIKELEATNAALEESLIEQRSQAQTATTRFEQLQEQYKAVVPEGPVQDLLTLLRKQLEEGRDPERLAFLIRSARPPRNCSEPETKRFVVSTPANAAPQSKISVADGRIVVTGLGVSAKSEQGQPEAWYDPTREVALEFYELGGNKVEKKGIFPLHYSMVVGSKEYRFTVTDGARSFAKVTFDSCDYP